MDKYEIGCLIAKGAYGKIYRAVLKSDGRNYIIKTISLDEMNPSDIQVALKEAELLKKFDHPNIIHYLENFIENGNLLIVMEYAPGGNLNQFLLHQSGKFLPEQQILSFFSQILLALHHVHSQNIIHRDLKTSNILLNYRRDIVKLGDFGISIILSTKSAANTVIGTPAYLSPELCQGKPYNNKSDMWALGCILYELTTLTRAFDADTLSAVVMKIMHGIHKPANWCYDSEIWDIILKLLNHNPDERYSTDMVMALPVLYNTIFDFYTDCGKQERKLPVLLKPTDLENPTVKFISEPDLSIKVGEEEKRFLYEDL